MVSFTLCVWLSCCAYYFICCRKQKALCIGVVTGCAIVAGFVFIIAFSFNVSAVGTTVDAVNGTLHDTQCFSPYWLVYIPPFASGAVFLALLASLCCCVFCYGCFRTFCDPRGNRYDRLWIKFTNFDLTRTMSCTSCHNLVSLLYLHVHVWLYILCVYICVTTYALYTPIIIMTRVYIYYLKHQSGTTLYFIMTAQQELGIEKLRSSTKLLLTSSNMESTSVTWSMSSLSVWPACSTNTLEVFIFLVGGASDSLHEHSINFAWYSI